MSRHQQIGQATIIMLKAVLLLFIALLLVGYSHRAWDAVTFVYPLDYGEGPLLAQTLQLARLQNIYHSTLNSPPYTIANYTPLFPLAQTPLAWLFGPAYWYGRLISIMSGLAAAFFCSLILHALTGSRQSAIFSGLILLTGPYVTMWSIYNRVDTLALALSLAALWVIARWPRATWALVTTAMLLVAAVYTRQTYGLAAPLAAFVWLLFRPPRRWAFMLVSLVAGTGTVLFLLLNALTQGGFYFNIVAANVNAYSTAQLAHFVSQLWLLTPILIVLGGIFVVGGGWANQRSWQLITPYLLGAMIVGLTIGKAGSSINYFLELSAALSLAAGALLAWQRHNSWRYGGLVVLLILQMAWLWLGLPSHILIQDKLGKVDEMHRLLATVQQADGPVLADEALGILPLARQQVFIQPFEVTQLAGDLWDQSLFLTQIRQQEFSYIIMHKASAPPSIREESHWTPQMLAVIEQKYVPTTILTGSTVVYIPR